MRGYIVFTGRFSLPYSPLFRRGWSFRGGFPHDISRYFSPPSVAFLVDEGVYEGILFFTGKFSLPQSPLLNLLGELFSPCFFPLSAYDISLRGGSLRDLDACSCQRAARGTVIRWR